MTSAHLSSAAVVLELFADRADVLEVLQGIFLADFLKVFAL